MSSVIFHFPDLVEPFILALLPQKLTINEYQRLFSLLLLMLLLLKLAESISMSRA